MQQVDGGSAPTERRTVGRERAWWTGPDRVATVLLLLLLGSLAVLALHAGGIVSLSTAVCGDGVACDRTVVSAAVHLATYGPLVVLLTAVVWTVRRVGLGRPGRVVPMLGICVALGLVAVADALVRAAISTG